MADFRSQWSGCVEDLAGKTKALSKRFGFAETWFFQDPNGSQVCFDSMIHSLRLVFGNRIMFFALKLSFRTILETKDVMERHSARSTRWRCRSSFIRCCQVFSTFRFSRLSVILDG